MPRRAEKTPAAADASLWQRAMLDVAPLRPRPHLTVPKPPATPAAKTAARQAPPRSAKADLPPLAVDRFAGIDKASALRLKRGRLPIEARLDLHGMTQAEAHRALLGFIRSGHAGGRRCVLVITGRGASGGTNGAGGVLRAAVPRWLAEPDFRPYLLAVATAQPHDGGTGALYVMLRRNQRVTEP